MDNTSDVMATVLIKLFRPLVRLLLRMNIPYKACAEALRWTYVDVATHEFSMGEQKQTKSRVAVITGLTRIEVERLQREGAKTMTETTRQFNRAAKVLSAWEADPKYRGADGKPLLIPLDGPVPSIAALVLDYSGGATLRAVLDEVLDKGNVRFHEDRKRYELVDANFLVFNDMEAELAILATSTSDLIATFERNIRLQQSDRRLQAYVEQSDMPMSQIPLVRDYVKKKSNEFLEELDIFLLNLASNSGDSSEVPCPRVGVGMYFFQDDPQQRTTVQMDPRGRRRRDEPAKIA